MLSDKVLNKKNKKEKPKNLSKITKNKRPVKKSLIKVTPQEVPQNVETTENTNTKFIMPSKNITADTVKKCVKAVHTLSEHLSKGNRMFEDETPIFAQIHCMRIQSTKGNISFVLPHSTVPSTGEVCLITPDLKKGKRTDHEPTLEHWEELLRKAEVTNVKTVLPMRQLRVEYDQFELKRRLLTQHDFILVDTRVLSHVSHLLGKQFFKKSNMLIPVRIKEQKLKKCIEVGLHTAMLRLNIGETSIIQVGHTGMPQEQVQENVLSLVKQLKVKYPGGENNIRSIFLKLPLSICVPLYITLGTANNVVPPKLIQKKPKNYQVVEGELSTIPGSTVSVAPDGTVRVTKKGEADYDSDLEIEDDADFDGGDAESDAEKSE